MPTAPHTDGQGDAADGGPAHGLHGTPRQLVPVPLRKGVYVLPNLITTAGLFCGFYSIIASLRAEFLIAAIAIMAAHVFDTLDGRVARLTKTTSRFGIEYDSLCDLVAFGVAPGILVYCWALVTWGTFGCWRRRST
jgi:CDP-diacylglycerol--serine O-phosphatidyltransferase